MAATPVLISVEEYLSTAYRPDCDYIDGEVLERNMGEIPHGCLQGFFIFVFRTNRDLWHIRALPETRLQVGPKSFRVPDVMILPESNTDRRIVRTPPLLCIEVLSSEDRMSRIQQRLNDYAAMGVQAMWVVDPWRGTAFFAGPDAVLHEKKDQLTVPRTPIAISVPEIFAELDRLP